MGDSASDPMDLDNLAAAPDVAAAALKPASWCLPKPKLLPKTHEPAMIGYEFKQDGVTRKIQLKTANKRAKTSWIWRHGFECRRKGPGPHPQKPDWLCGICWDRGKIEVSNTGSTTPAIQHLNEAHDLNADGVIVRSKPIVNALQNTAGDDTEAEPVVYNIVTQTEVNKFNQALIAWIVLAHLAMACVENDAFRLLILCLNPGIYKFLYKSGNTIRKLVIGDYEDRKKRVIADLAAARSKVHISFDMWTTPNKKLAMLGIVAHYLTRDLTTRSLLIGLKKVEGSHTGVNLARYIVPVIQEFGIEGNLGYFISDNAGPNDTAVEAICKKLGLADAVHRRLRCLGHVINLAAKAFLFGKDVESFDFEISEFAMEKLEVRQALELLVFWRKKGPLGKLHNLILWICRTPERAEAFMKTTIDEAEARNGKFAFSA
jgi:hypothetical protein